MISGIRCALFAIGSLAAGVQAAETAAPAEPVAAAAPLPDDRIAANHEFRAAFDAGRYVDALTAASRVVDLTGNQFGAAAPELVNPVTNLATTYYRLQQYGLAMDAYRRALALLDNETDTANPRLVRPLHGLGLSLQALDRNEEAIVPLKSAIDIIRNREGLFALPQLPLLRPLSTAYMATHQIEEAGSTQQYALTVAETAYGRSDVRLLGPLDQYARWNELAGRYSFARLLHARAVQVANNRTEDGKVLAIPGLRGIARTYRLAYVYGESEEAAATAVTASMADAQLQRATIGPATEGERALRTALDLLRTATPADPRSTGEVLTDLGDWYLTGGADSRALTAYREAWKYLDEAGATVLLATPVPLTYRAPSIAVSRGTEDAGRYEERDLVFTVSVNADGEVREAAAANPVAAQESAERSVASALRRAVFRPAITGGEPVAKTDVPFRERVYVRRADTGDTEK